MSVQVLKLWHSNGLPCEDWAKRLTDVRPAIGSRGASAYDLYVDKQYTECIHWLCFAGNVLCNAGLWKREQLLDDSGLIHLVVHRMSTTKRSRKKYRAFVKSEHRLLLLLLRLFDERTAKLGY